MRNALNTTSTGFLLVPAYSSGWLSDWHACGAASHREPVLTSGNMV
ncbi:MAG: hypothetical protein U0271_48735 [Polyangiaceae bacterium]